MQSSRQSWFPLDNAAKIFPPALSGHFTTVFRIAVVLKQAVHLPTLQAALETVLPRFPVFKVHLKKGAFWYYMEENLRPPRVYPETRYPCMWRPTGGSGVFPFRVKAYRRRIALEVAHMVSDGSGAMAFLRSLTAEYLRRRGLAPREWGDILRPDADVQAAELEDGFLRVFDPAVPGVAAQGRAYHLPLPISARGAYYVVTGLVPADALRERAAGYGASLTEYLLALLFSAYQEVATELEGAGTPTHAAGSGGAARADGKAAGARGMAAAEGGMAAGPGAAASRPIRILVPVDLRRFYGSRTTRNFFVFVEPEIDLRLGRYAMGELVQLAHHFMRLHTTEKVLSRYVARNVRPESRTAMRLMPLRAKDLVLAYAHQRYGEQSNTGSLSNLGRVAMPPEQEKAIDHFEVVPIPSRTTKVNCAVVTYANTMAVSFGKMTPSRILERAFFRSLRRVGIPVKVITNDGRVTAAAPRE
ncbi:MAG: hypothetical protein ACOCYG_07835 [Spirochaetota bacterium]